MMMQMLKDGGMDLLTDSIRMADENNPRGYLEYEKAKKMMTDVSWLDDANGKAIKIIAPLLSYLPPKYDYRIIFMEREMSEVLRSQQIMLGRRSEIQKNAFPIVLDQAFKKQLEQARSWMERSPNVTVLYVQYADVVSEPQETAESIAEFLGEELNIQQMAAAVDASLYHNKYAPSTGIN